MLARPSDLTDPHLTNWSKLLVFNNTHTTLSGSRCMAHAGRSIEQLA